MDKETRTFWTNVLWVLCATMLAMTAMIGSFVVSDIHGERSSKLRLACIEAKGTWVQAAPTCVIK